MARVGLKLLVFLAPVLVGLGWVEWRLRSTPDMVETKRRVVAQGGSGAEIVIVGNSHANRGLDPNAFACPTINLAIDGSGFDETAREFERYRSELKGLRLLLIPVSFPGLEYIRGADEPPAEVPDGGLDRGLRAWRRRSAVVRSGPAGGLKAAVRGGDPCDEKGWMPLAEVPGAKVPARAAERAAAHRRWMRGENRDPVLLALRSLIGGARASGASVVLVVPPFTRGYVQAWSEQDLESFRDRLAELAAQTGAGISDYSTDERFSDADFSDADHMSPLGAARFAGMLAREVVPGAVNCTPGRQQRGGP